jgi:hypothetical protein
MSEPRRLIQVSEIDGRSFVRFTSRRPIISWDFDEIESVAQELYGLLRGDRRDSIILDFEGREDWLPANFEAKMVALHRRSQHAGGTLKLCNLSSSIQDQFRSNGLIQVFHIFPTLE